MRGSSLASMGACRDGLRSSTRTDRPLASNSRPGSLPREASVEIVVRSFVVYVFLWLLLRALGKRELGELSAFELLLLVVLGDIVQQAITLEDYSITGAVLAVGTIAMFVLASSYVSFRWSRGREALESIPSVV